jgi:putative sulfotransferase
MKNFVVGSGRCGSTLVGNMLGRHPDLLELTEFFAALDRQDVFSDRRVSGPVFAEFLDRVDIANEVIHRRGVVPKEVLSPGREHGVPPLMIATIPTHFASDPEGAYQKLLQAVADFPAQTFREHYDALFAWLMDRTGKRYWVERSGTSVEYLAELAELYPDGRYVYLTRDGAECALSMQAHVVFQFYVSTHFEPLTAEELRATEFGGAAISPQDPISRRLRPDYLPARKYGEYWSRQQALGFKGLARLNPAQVMYVQFEQVLADPEHWLQAIADFFGLPPRPGWTARAAALIEGIPPARLPALPESVQAEIRDGCAIGDLLLDPTGSPWDVCKSRTAWERTAES